METRVNSIRAHKTFTKINMPNLTEISSEGFSGGLGSFGRIRLNFESTSSKDSKGIFIVELRTTRK